MIKLGQKNPNTGAPMALDHFLCPGEVREIYGEKPTVLDIRFPMEHADDIFPQFYKLYGQSAGLKAYSDGETVWTRGEKPGEWLPSKAPSKEDLEKQGYRGTATLNFILPKVSYAGTYQINTRSFHSIVKLNSSIEYIQHLFGRIQGLPLKLMLESTEAHITINGKPAKKVVYTMRLHFDEKEIMEFMKKRGEALAKLAAPAPLIEAPAQVEAPVEDEEDEEDFEDEEIGDGIMRSDLPK